MLKKKMQMFEILIYLLPEYKDKIELFFRNHFHKFDLIEEYYLIIMKIGVRAKLTAPS